MRGRTSSPSSWPRGAGQRLAAFKVPRYLEFVDALPYTATGRIAKPALPREHTASEWEVASPTGTAGDQGRP